LWNAAVNIVGASPALNERQRARLLRRAGLAVDPTARIQQGVYFFGAAVEIGPRSWINHGCYFDCRDRIVIGKDCDLGMEVMLCTSSHAVGAVSRRAGRYFTAPVVICDGCWLGSRATVLPGVTVGAGCIVAAGAVVREDCSPSGLYAGVPARRVRDLEPSGSDEKFP
jgi:maltose O-acetyltransferase